jgi:hypothetical protein
MYVYQFTKTIGVFFLFVTSTVLLANKLTLAESEQIALDSDFITRQFNTRSAGLNERAIADGQLPDPKIKLGIMNLPVNSFDCGQEPMTQLQVGIQQSFPRGRTLYYKSLKTRDIAVVDAAQNSESTLKAYQNDLIDFTILMRARLTELNTQFDMLIIRINLAKSQASLLYSPGEIV